MFTALERLPLTPSGKVDRRSLPEPEAPAEQLGSQYAAPRNETEEALAAVWAEVLGVEKVGIHDNFFDLSTTTSSTSAATPSSPFRSSHVPARRVSN
ncbi:hypothetical protein N566_06890 [Streptomycetaceae bacterium MP113-05]|nr:hypothetical protein N566_06890 [Streptomycetaceae bacterium MP113-05]